jgi:hypothetical protein
VFGGGGAEGVASDSPAAAASVRSLGKDAGKRKAHQIWTRSSTSCLKERPPPPENKAERWIFADTPSGRKRRLFVRIRRPMLLGA